MNTKSQSTVEIYHAHVPASDSEATVSTSKTQVFVKRFDGIDLERWADMRQWCVDNLYHGGYYETLWDTVYPTWDTLYPTFYFRDEKEYTLFLLRWS